MDHLQHTEDNDNTSDHVFNKALLCYKKDKTKLVLEAGCDIYNPDFDNKIFFAGKNVYTTGPEFNESYIPFKDSLSDTAMKFINSPYIWGGRMPSGTDC